MNIFIKKYINAPAENVFLAISSAKGFTGWWSATCEIDPKSSGIFRVQFKKNLFTEEMVFEVEEIIAGKLLTLRCLSNNVFESWRGSLLIFELISGKAMTTLTFKQVSPNLEWEKSQDYEPSRIGWEFFVESLKCYCETGKGDPWLADEI